MARLEADTSISGTKCGCTRRLAPQLLAEEKQKVTWALTASACHLHGANRITATDSKGNDGHSHADARLSVWRINQHFRALCSDSEDLRYRATTQAGRRQRPRRRYLPPPWGLRCPTCSNYMPVSDLTHTTAGLSRQRRWHIGANSTLLRHCHRLSPPDYPSRGSAVVEISTLRTLEYLRKVKLWSLPQACTAFREHELGGIRTCFRRVACGILPLPQEKTTEDNVARIPHASTSSTSQCITSVNVELEAFASVEAEQISGRGPSRSNRLSHVLLFSSAAFVFIELNAAQSWSPQGLIKGSSRKLRLCRTSFTTSLSNVVTTVRRTSELECKIPTNSL